MQADDETAPAEPLQAADIALLPRQRAHHFGGPVGRIVVDENDLPGNAGEHPVEALDNDRNVVALVERRDDDRELGRGVSAPGALTCVRRSWAGRGQGRLSALVPRYSSHPIRIGGIWG